MKGKWLCLLAVSVLMVGCAKADTVDTEVANDTNITQTQNGADVQEESTEHVCVFENYVSNNDATYTEDGTETGACSCGLTDTRTAEGSKLEYTYTDLDKSMYAKQTVNVRDLPNADGNKLGSLSTAQEVKVLGQCNETSWYKIEYDGGVGYVTNSYLQDSKPAQQSATQTPSQTPAEGTSTVEACPYELYTWYDMGWYYFKLIPSKAEFAYDAPMEYYDTLKERYPDCSTWEGGCPTKWGNYVHICATYPIQGNYVFN